MGMIRDVPVVTMRRKLAMGDVECHFCIAKIRQFQTHVHFLSLLAV